MTDKPTITLARKNVPVKHNATRRGIPGKKATIAREAAKMMK